LFFWGQSGKLIALAVNVPCPAQQAVERVTINADFWHPVREALHKRYGAEVCVLGWIGAAGDQCPVLPFAMYDHRAEERMQKLRKLTQLEEIARRIVRAVDDAYEVVKDDRQTNVPLIHEVETFRLPMRLVTETEYAKAKAAYQQAADKIAKDPAAADRAYAGMKWHERVVKRFENQKTNPKPTYEMEMHVLRIGDAVVCTNPFELFTDYGIQIKARSPAVQTFVIQLTADYGDYLPTERAVRGGSYSAEVESDQVGPEGGQMLVDRTVDAIKSMWIK
jgi:hypothetical protein